ncbi:MAG: hypothetical protein ACOX0T_02195 [Pelotomaculum sp.]|jgi:hypothetical protein
MSYNAKLENQHAGCSDTVELTVKHCTLGKVTMVGLKERELFPGADVMYTSFATITDQKNNSYQVPLWELWLQDKPLPVLVLDYEQSMREKEQRLPGNEDVYMHSKYGIIGVIDKYDDNNWFCRVLSGVDINYPIKYDLDFDAFSDENSIKYSQLKEFYCHPSELIPVSDLKKLKSKDGQLYAMYNHGAYDTTMNGLDEFVYIITDLPRLTYTRYISTRKGVKKVTRKEPPNVLAYGENTGRYYILPADMLWRITGEFEVIATGEKIAERYQWQKPTPKRKPTEQSQSFTYPMQQNDSTFIPEVADETLREEMALFKRRLPPQEALMRHVNTNAWYWKQPPVSAKELGFSSIKIFWSGKTLTPGNQVATVQVAYKGKQYKLPIYVGPNKELTVKTRSRKVAAFLCRYTSIKHAQLRLTKDAR